MIACKPGLRCTDLAVDVIVLLLLSLFESLCCAQKMVSPELRVCLGPSFERYSVVAPACDASSSLAAETFNIVF
jgi:hypothetical protein